jgi:hypothetical protein
VQKYFAGHPGVWLAVNGVAPLATMSFLDEARARGVLRQEGGSYQFRHAALKEVLLTPSLQFTRDQQGRMSLARWLLATGIHLLPPAEQARYGEELRAELDAITAAGGSRRIKVAYAIRQLASAPRLRTELRPSHQHPPVLESAILRTQFLRLSSEAACLTTKPLAS